MADRYRQRSVARRWRLGHEQAIGDADAAGAAEAEARQPEARRRSARSARPRRRTAGAAATGSRSSDPTADAELLVIVRRRGDWRARLVACDLYVTLEPCPTCARGDQLARIRRLYYGAPDPKGGGVMDGPLSFV